MALDAHQEKILNSVDGAQAQILAVSHAIHARPELSGQEAYASGLLADRLEQHGFRVERSYAGIPTAFRARKGNPSGVKVAFLAEYDALPGLGHGCGHNLIASSALTAGIGLGSVIDQLPGEVWVLGTPSEETLGAKCLMVQRGCFDEVDAALMIHPHAGNYLATYALALTAIRVSFYGKTAHAAASPWEGLNALDALILTFNNLNALRQQLLPDARIHGVITHGGVAPNVIPEYTEGSFYVRAKSSAYLDQLLEKFKSCARAGAQAAGCRVEFVRDDEDFDDMVNNLTLAERVRAYLEQDLGSGPFEHAPENFGSIDMGNVSHVVPGVHLLIDITAGQPMSLHTHEFARAAIAPYADEALVRAGKALALAGYDLLAKPEFLAEVKREFNRTK